ncbi:hypothetical protein K458DRAFT_422892 [Lentithecium fluviatile CBS 122367]|uniref:Uncharacterized protein n=1 Tax=Lentithecium fluviatile CBS 122367 TaxID=1168545 RepID=A0A6G1ILA1_9PLEO|nr:hypothetical protein K458DRAFT_422892 [Lentithecium fluviatile CBS 122367]
MRAVCSRERRNSAALFVIAIVSLWLVGNAGLPCATSGVLIALSGGYDVKKHRYR